MTLIWLALLVFAGLLQMMYQPIWRGRLSGRRQPPTSKATGTLEPERPASGFGLKSSGPGPAMVAVGATLLLVRAAI